MGKNDPDSYYSNAYESITDRFDLDKVQVYSSVKSKKKMCGVAERYSVRMALLGTLLIVLSISVTNCASSSVPITETSSNSEVRVRRDVLDTLGNGVGMSKFELRCLVCHWAADVLVAFARSGYNPENVFSVATALCHVLNIEKKVSSLDY